MTIDAHAHIGDFTGFIRGGFHSADKLVDQWDQTDVEAGLISVLMRDIRAANDLTHGACMRFPDRIHGYIYLNPNDSQTSIAELERCAAEDCFKGVKLHPMNDAYYPFNEGFFPLYERIERLGLPILWHTGTYPYSSPLQVAYVARQFPGVPFILAHFALADLSWECFPAAELAANVVVDMTANPIIPLIDEWIDRFGAKRMLWGSDFPFYSVSYERVKVDHLGCQTSDKQLILSGNARRIFGL